ncbi:MAG: Cysteine--tRNA ligase [Verrucomicrobiota bacterium]|jgi:cysteinyl-tRNA synthetase
MALRLFNTLHRRVEEFSPLFPEAESVGFYCCGPTVYDFGHIGNFRTFVFADLLRRHLEFRGFRVNHVMNITDVEDKIIRQVAATGLSLAEFTGKYTEAFLADLTTLSCRTPHHLPKATDYIPQIIDLIRRLEARGIAYRAGDGSVYFSINKYRACGCRYGQLVTLDPDAQRRTERVSGDSYEKDDLADFALWKARVPGDGAVFWDSPWGEGRPGWHIECSAMSMAILGPSFDLHLGGEDLAFPHHEDEIAQSEGTGLQQPGRPFVKHWVHAAHLLVDGKKMSKSLGNFFTVRDLLNRGFNGREIRFLLLGAHYRETFNFTLEGLEAARTALSRLDATVAQLTEKAGPSATSGSGPARSVPETALETSLGEALDDDLNVSKAWAAIFDWVRETNAALASGALDAAAAAARLRAWRRVDEVMGLGARPSEEFPAEALALLERRNAAKAARDFATADAVRGELKVLGWTVEDSKTGSRLKRL